MDFTYTREFDVDSSFVTGLMYDANTGNAFVEIEGDYIYQYRDVNESDLERLSKADSVGGEYNTRFKPTYGPSVTKFDTEDVSYDIVPFNVTHIAQWGLKSAPATDAVGDATQEYSLSTPPVFDNSVSGAPLYTGPTQEFSFAPKPALTVVPDADSGIRSRVEFKINGGGDAVYGFDSNAESLEVAIDEVNAYVSRLGATGKVISVEFVFDE